MKTVSCLLRDDSFSQAFTIQISGSRCISDLKLIITDKTELVIGKVDHTNLPIYIISIANGDDTALRRLYQQIDEEVNSISIPGNTETIDSVFPSLKPNHIHILVGIPSKRSARPSPAEPQIRLEILIPGYVICIPRDQASYTQVRFRAAPRGTMVEG